MLRGALADEYGFLQIHAAYTLAVSTAFGAAEAEKQHYFRVGWLPTAGQRRAPVRKGDTLSCLLGACIQHGVVATRNAQDAQSAKT